MTRPKILIIGDSHVHAIRDSLREAQPESGEFDVTALRIKIEYGEKKGAGDVTFDEALKLCNELSGRDFLATAVRGNQYNTVGLIQHPRPFDVMLPDAAPLAANKAELIPLGLFRQFFHDTLRSGYSRMLMRIKQATAVPMACLAPPAPKEDNEHIKQGAETFFREAGISEFGVSPPQLRLKLWTLQDEALALFCKENGMLHVGNPPEARDENGYLKREYYFRDATHGNTSYGALVVKQLIALASR